MHFKILKTIAASWLSDSFRVHQIRFSLGILQRSSKPRSCFKGPYL